MGQLSKVLRDAEGGGLVFFCPGCDMHHMVQVGEGAGPRWGWNQSVDRPTFTPSVLVRGHGLTPAGRAAWEAWSAAGHPAPAPDFENTATVCHSFVTEGRIQFLGDCTHHLANQTVDLPECDW